MSAVDLDQDENSQIVYSIDESGDDDVITRLFVIDAQSGTITLTFDLTLAQQQPLENTTITLTIRATDGGSPALSSTVRLGLLLDRRTALPMGQTNGASTEDFQGFLVLVIGCLVGSIGLVVIGLLLAVVARRVLRRRTSRGLDGDGGQKLRHLQRSLMDFERDQNESWKSYVGDREARAGRGGASRKVAVNTYVSQNFARSLKVKETSRGHSLTCFGQQSETIGVSYRNSLSLRTASLAEYFFL